MTPMHLSALDFLAPLRITGPDALPFLQGQLSADVLHIGPGICQLASCSSPQGRVQAVLTLVPDAEGVIALVPASLVDQTLARLRKYVMRSKVALDKGDDLKVLTGNSDALARADLPVPAQAGTCVTHGGMRILRWHEPAPGLAPRFIVLADGGAAAGDPGIDSAWRLAEIRSGLPQVLPETYETFVAQMLNIDLLGGIAFDKGCYTGQEIIARTQYRGAIKRRMFRFAAACPPPPPGTRILANGQHAGDVVDAAATAEGCELLAVVGLAKVDDVLRIDDRQGELVRLELPYGVNGEK